MKLKRRLIMTMASIMLLSLAGCNLSINDELPTYEESSLVVVGDVAPDFEAELLDGRKVSLSDYHGAPLMLILFSHTCPDCKMLLDDLQATIESDRALPAILAVCRDGNRGDIEAYSTENGYTMDMASDADRAIFELYATTYVPRAYLLDSNGIVDSFSIEYEPTHITNMLSRYENLR